MEKKKNKGLTQEHWTDAVRSDYVAVSDYETFDAVLKRYISETLEVQKINQSDISKATGIDGSTISKLKNGEVKPNTYMIVLLSLAMRLTHAISDYLFFCAGIQLNNSLEHRIYRLFLDGCAYNEIYNIKNCNKMLAENNITMLSV